MADTRTTIEQAGKIRAEVKGIYSPAPLRKLAADYIAQEQELASLREQRKTDESQMLVMTQQIYDLREQLAEAKADHETTMAFYEDEVKQLTSMRAERDQAWSNSVCNICHARNTSDTPCICGDTGLARDAVIGLQKELLQARRERDQAKGQLAVAKAKLEQVTGNQNQLFNEVASLKAERDQARAELAECKRLLDMRTGCLKCKGRGFVERHQPGFTHYDTDGNGCPSYHFEKISCTCTIDAAISAREDKPNE